MIKKAREALHGRIKKNVKIEELKVKGQIHRYVKVKFFDKRTKESRNIGEVGFYKKPGDKTWQFDYAQG